jgi:hypothetical protein
MKAHRVVVLDEGHIVEFGPPGLLLAKPGSRFASLAQAQLISPGGDAPSSGRHARGRDRGGDRFLRAGGIDSHSEDLR